MDDPGLKPATRILAQLFMPAIVPASQAAVAAELRLTMLKAAIAVEQSGPEALALPALQDPFAKTAFQYEKTAGGFRLRSKTPGSRTGLPMTLEVGGGSGK